MTWHNVLCVMGWHGMAWHGMEGLIGGQSAKNAPCTILNNHLFLFTQERRRVFGGLGRQTPTY